MRLLTAYDAGRPKGAAGEGLSQRATAPIPPKRRKKPPRGREERPGRRREISLRAAAGAALEIRRKVW